MVSEDKVLNNNSKCICGNGDAENMVENHFENSCPTCGKEGTLQIETLENIQNYEPTKNEDGTENNSAELDPNKNISNKIVCTNCGSEYCGQDGYDMYGGNRAKLMEVNPDEVTGSEDELSEPEEDEPTYLTGWEGICDLLRPLDAEAMVIQRGDYVIVKKIDMPQSAELWAYEGINIVDDSVTITDYTPEIYNTFVIRWGEEFDNELEFVFKKHKQLFGERKQILEAKKQVPASDEEEGEDGEKSKEKSESKDGGNIFSGITNLIFGTGGQKEKEKENNKKKKASSSSGSGSSSESNDEDEDKDKSTEEVPITTKEEAIQFGMKQVGKAKRDDGHTVELKVIGNQNFMVGEWCHIRIPSLNEDSYMFISKCSFESSPDSEYINSLTLVDYPPSLGKVLGGSDSGSDDEENTDESTDQQADGENQNGENGQTDGSNSNNNSNSSN